MALPWKDLALIGSAVSAIFIAGGTFFVAVRAQDQIMVRLDAVEAEAKRFQKLSDRMDALDRKLEAGLSDSAKDQLLRRCIQLSVQLAPVTGGRSAGETRIGIIKAMETLKCGKYIENMGLSAPPS